MRKKINHRRKKALRIIGIVLIFMIFYYNINSVKLIKVYGLDNSSLKGFNQTIGTTTGSSIILEILNTYEEDDESVKFDGTWYQANASNVSGGTAKYTSVKGSTVEFSFYGSNVRIMGKKSKDCGKIKVTVDGIYEEIIDTYSLNSEYKAIIFEKTDLSEENHNIIVEVIEEKNIASSNNLIVIDAFQADIRVLKRVDVTGVELNETDVTVEEGQGTLLKATVIPENATNNNVTWSSDNPEVALVDQEGNIIAVKEGETLIRATTLDGSKSSTCRVLVNKGMKLSIFEEEDESVKFDGTWYQANSSNVSGGTAKYTSVKGSTVEFSFSGSNIRVIGKKARDYGKIKVTIDGIDEEIIDTYSPNSEYKAIIFEKTDLSQENHKVRIEVIGEKNTLSLNTVIVIDAFQADSRVLERVDVTGVALNETEVTVEEGQGTLLTATVIPENSTNKNLTWKSDNPEVALVDQEGNIIAVKEGETIITVTTEDGNKSITCRVVVNKRKGITKYEEDDESVKFDGTWYQVNSSNVSGGTAKYTPVKGSTVEFSFYGSNIRVLGKKARDYGKIKVTVDGIYEEIIDTYSPKSEYKAIIFEKTDLSQENHKVTIEVIGEKNTLSLNTVIVIDAFEAEGRVEENVEVTGVELNKKDVIIEEAQTIKLTAKVLPENATNNNVTWNSDNPEVALVDQEGNIIAVKEGETLIRVTTLDGSKSTTCRVLVNKGMELSIFEEEDESVNFTGKWYKVYTTKVSGSTAKYTNAKGSKVEFGFYGSNIRVIGKKARDYGKIKVTIDGIYEEIIDTYSPNSEYKAIIFEKTDLSQEKHKVTIEVIGEKNTLSSNTIIVIDAFQAEGRVVENVEVTGVELNKNDVTIEEGKTIELIVKVLPENASNKNVIWTSSDESIALVDENGVVTAVASGEATITVTTENGGYEATCNVKVTVQVVGVELNETDVTIEEGQTIELVAMVLSENEVNKDVSIARSTQNLMSVFSIKASVYENDAENDVMWETSNENIAIVDKNGIVTAVGAGDATITVTTESGGYEANCNVKVTVKVVGVELNKKDVTIEEGRTIKLTAKVLPENATNNNVTWNSDNPEVALVDQEGNIIAVKEGETLIRATTLDGSKSSTCRVLVNKGMGLSIFEEDDESVNFTGKWYKVYTTKVSGNAAKYTPVKGSTVEFSFYGSNIRVIGKKARDYGKIKVTVDGIYEEIIDTYSPKSEYKAIIFEKTDLSKENHKVTIEVIGEKNTLSSNTIIVIDAFEADGRVEENVKVVGVELNETDITVEEGQTIELTAKVLPENASNKNVIWTSSDESIALVDKNGVVTAVASGEATITVTTENGGYEATCNVKVPEEEHTIRISPMTKKNGKSKNAYAYVDSFVITDSEGNEEVIQDDDERLRYVGNWKVDKSKKLTSGDTVRYTKDQNAYVEFIFRGESIEWRGYRSPSQGVAEIVVDGVREAVNCYSSKPIVNAVMYKKEFKEKEPVKEVVKEVVKAAVKATGIELTVTTEAGSDKGKSNVKVTEKTKNKNSKYTTVIDIRSNLMKLRNSSKWNDVYQGIYRKILELQK